MKPNRNIYELNPGNLHLQFSIRDNKRETYERLRSSLFEQFLIMRETKTKPIRLFDQSETMLKQKPK